MAARKRLRILVAGFGPFPGAPVNPTSRLVRALARRPRPASERVEVICHVFSTRYRAVDRALPKLIKQHRPDAMLMFGLATRSRAIRIEMQARNRISHHPDAGGFTPGPCAIETGAPRVLPVRADPEALLSAAQSAALPARLSRDAGDYLCNYTLWRVLRSGEQASGPAFAAFVHVPALSQRVTIERLIETAEALLPAVISSLRHRTR